MSLRANLHGSASSTADSTTASGSTPAENPRSVTATNRTADSLPAYGSTPAEHPRSATATTRTADSLPAYGSTPAEHPRSATATTRTADSPPAYGSTSAGRDRLLRTAESTPDKQTFAHPPLSFFFLRVPSRTTHMSRPLFSSHARVSSSRTMRPLIPSGGR